MPYDLCPDLFMIYILGRIRAKTRWERSFLTVFVALWMALQTYLIVVEHNPGMKPKRHDLKALLAVPNVVILSGMLLLTLPNDPRCVSVALWTTVWGGIALMQWLKILGQGTMIIWQMMHEALFKNKENPPPLTAEDSPTRIISDPGPPDELPPHYELVETTIGEHARPDIRGLEPPPYCGYSCYTEDPSF